ncbi:MAG: hypothetical protein HUK21_09015 [Fibrobacteraceae bacterium]|nr:hypothetical protein [Fibrobacteraceae bacterium]MCF0216598.1 hypothetical protein [Fibrobacteraceae bacterium]
MNFRDKALEIFIRNHPLIKKFGEVQSLSINATNGTADISILLCGEPAPIQFRGYYYFDDTDKGTDIVVRQISCERPWINEALNLYLSKTTLRYTLPGIAGGIAKIFF